MKYRFRVNRASSNNLPAAAGAKRPSSRRRVGGDSQCRLEAPGWNSETRRALVDLISKGAGQQLPVVLDFDNTLICGDIGEAALAVLARSGALTPAKVRGSASPPFRLPGGGLIQLASCADVVEYYEALLASTAHQAGDVNPMSNAYAWAVEIMADLQPLEIANATRRAFEWPQPKRPAYIEVTPGKTAMPVPFFYPEALELISELLRLRFDVWIVSASNVWSVRWTVLHALNPVLRERGLNPGVLASHVIGVSTLMADRRGQLYKDTALVREDDAYAAMADKTLAGLRLTSRLQFPVPVYSGKVAAVFDLLGRNPYLAVGDSPGDHPLLAISEHRLWLARLEKPAFQKATRRLIRQTGSHGWLIQPVLARTAPGFVSGLEEASKRLCGLPSQVRQAAAAVLPRERH